MEQSFLDKEFTDEFTRTVTNAIEYDIPPSEEFMNKCSELMDQLDMGIEKGMTLEEAREALAKIPKRKKVIVEPDVMEVIQSHLIHVLEMDIMGRYIGKHKFPNVRPYAIFGLTPYHTLHAINSQVHEAVVEFVHHNSKEYHKLMDSHDAECKQFKEDTDSKYKILAFNASTISLVSPSGWPLDKKSIIVAPYFFSNMQMLGYDWSNLAHNIALQHYPYIVVADEISVPVDRIRKTFVDEGYHTIAKVQYVTESGDRIIGFVVHSPYYTKR